MKEVQHFVSSSGNGSDDQRAVHQETKEERKILESYFEKRPPDYAPGEDIYRKVQAWVVCSTVVRVLLCESLLRIMFLYFEPSPGK